MSLITIIDMIVIAMYFIGEATTEGYTWASPARRLKNVFIKGGFSNKEAEGVLDYHGWRFFESFYGFYGAIRLLGLYKGIGLFLVMLFVYERILNKIVSDKWFKPNTATYNIYKWSFPRKQWHDWLALVTGLGIFLYL